jgi:hypothetical protein
MGKKMKILLNKMNLFPNSKSTIIQFFCVPVLLFCWAFLLRKYFFCGFIMGDDSQEFGLIHHLMMHGIRLQDQLFQRFMGWIFNALSCKLFGLSESSYFLPILLISSSFSIIGYNILLNHGYSLKAAALSGLMIASAPFEVLAGVTRMNDLILAWFMVIALWALLTLKHNAVMQGAIIAACLWLGFYVKLWIVYILPLIFLYYGQKILKHQKWKGAISFFVCSFLFHGAISIFWKIKVGSFFPYIQTHAAHYAVPLNKLLYWFGLYPRMLFIGSEFGTTLFGAVPYLLALALPAKLVLSFLFTGDKKTYWDSLDFWLCFYYASLLLLINFFPNAFVFDKYYSMSRIFRYLTPVSFPMTLHLAKLIIDIYNILHKYVNTPKWKMIVTFCLLIGLNIYHTAEATRPGRTFYKNLKLVIEEIKKISPPVILSEDRLAYLIKNAYLQNSYNKEAVLRIKNTYIAKDYERWLIQNETTFPENTMLLTGLGGYVFYGAHGDGFRLSQFKNKLSSVWKLHKEFGLLDFLPVPEKVRLWKLSHKE